MRKYFVLMVLLAFSSLSLAEELTTFYSANRYFNESYPQAMQRSLKESSRFGVVKAAKDSPVELMKSIEEVDFSKAPELDSYQDLLKLFEYVRDTRFLHQNENTAFLRRISWLYPDDGCFARAALANHLAHQFQMTRAAKLFVFGDLSVKTPYSPYGEVGWWYHVALLVNVGQTSYVLDPAIEPQKPLLAMEWFEAMTKNTKGLKAAICHPFTYTPGDHCLNAINDPIDKAGKAESYYLEEEWTRMRVLGFDPIQLLGESPPWLNALF